MKLKTWIGLLCVFTLLTACQNKERKAVLELLERRSAALEKGDVPGYLATLSKSYGDQIYRLKDSEPVIKKRFAEKPWPRVIFETPEIFIKGDQAVINENFAFEGPASGKTHQYRDTEHLQLKKEDSGWSIVSGDEVYRFLAGRLEEQVLIEQALDRRAEALNHKNLDLYMTVVSPGYSDKGKTFASIRDDIKGTFDYFKEINYRSFDRKIWFFGTTATVQQHFAMEAKSDDEPKSFDSIERFDLARGESGWLITKGL